MNKLVGVLIKGAPVEDDDDADDDERGGTTMRSGTRGKQSERESQRS